MSRIQIHDIPVMQNLEEHETRQVAGAGDIVPTDQCSFNFGRIEFENRASPMLMLSCASGQHG